MELVLQNGELEFLLDFLARLDLNIKESRMRNRLKKEIHKQLREVVFPERKIIYEDYALFKDDGEYDADENGIIQFKSPAHKKVAMEMIDSLFNEEFYIECNSANALMFKTMYTVFEALEEDESVKVSGQMAELVESWIDKFEEINTYYTTVKEKE